MLAFPSRRRRTILALHGFGSRPAVFQFQLAPLLKSLREKHERQEGKDGAELEIIWLEAPVWLPIGKPDVVRAFGGPYRCWWWRDWLWASPASIEAAIAYVAARVDLSAVDHIFGFSQGAVLGCWLSAMAERGTLTPRCPPLMESACSWKPGQRVVTPPGSPGESRPFKSMLAICAIHSSSLHSTVAVEYLAGARAASLRKTHFLEYTPSMHLVGERDQFRAVSEGWAKCCSADDGKGKANTSASPLAQIKWFDGGHSAPRDAKVLDEVCDWVMARL